MAPGLARRAIGIAFGLIAAGASRTTAQPAAATTMPANFFPFYIPWDDATPGTANDMSFLNHRPAGKFGRVFARDGHFALADTGERIRFFATNLAAESALPKTHADADAIAASLAKRGINLVRLHHLDNTWAIGTASLWDATFPDHQHVDPAMLDRLDYLVSRLIANGIYVNLNLKVGKSLDAADGFPDGALADPSGAFPMQKRLDHFDERMIDLQKAYARTLLTHVNAYTRRSYVDEPGVALVEVSNENCLLTVWPGQPLGSGLERLSDFFRAELTAKWNAWLHRKYADDAAMLAAWNAGVVPLGASVVPAASDWIAEQGNGTTCDVERTPNAMSPLPDVSIRVAKPQPEAWHAQVYAVHLTLQDDQPYTIAFEARSDAPRSTACSATLDQEPWSSAGFFQTVETTPTWQRFEFPFTASGTVAGHVRIGFAVGDNVVPLQVRNVSIRAGSPGAMLAPGESLSANNVALPLGGATAARRDLVDFLADADVAYAEEMLRFVRDDLGVKSLAYVSQVQWGGLQGYRREAKSDVIDAHGYVGHPEFPADAPWSATRWTIANKSEVRRLGEGGASVLGDIAMWRQLGKPFTVSEYDQPAPSDFAAECIPMLASVAAAQDWDAVYTFAMPGYGALQPTKPEMITGFFDQLNHPAKAAFNAFAAVALRRGAIAPIASTATLSPRADAYRKTEYAEPTWRAAWPGVDALSSRLQVQFAMGDTHVDRAPASEASPLSIAKAARGPILKIAGPRAAGLIGFVCGATTTAGPLTVTADAQANDFAAVTVHTLDDKPIAETKRGLVTIVGRAENVGMRWNADRTSVGDGWGTGPVEVEGLRMTVSLARSRAARVYALDPRGKRKAEVPASFAGGRLTFDVTPQQASVWYEFAE